MKFSKKPFRHQHEVEEGPVRYWDTTPLLRPFDPPKPIWVVIGVAAAAGLAIGVMFSSHAIDQIMHGSERAAATVESNINREVSMDMPALQSIIALDDATILQQFADAGFETYNFLQEGESGVDIMKLPSDTTLAEAGLTLAGGFDRMSAVDASKFLTGSWRFTCNRENGTDIRIKYADLKATDATNALDTAMMQEGWIENGQITVTGEGVDEVGNTYREGTATTDAGTFTWRISVCPLADVYKINGLPETAQYVGIRMTS